jgi:rubredoxin
MKRFRCLVCGYIYDPETGDEDAGVTPGTAFADLPSGWSCPVCGCSADEFEEYD